MNRMELTRFAKVLSYMLGVRPDEFGLVLDHEGFVETKALLQALREEPGWSFVGKGHLIELMHSQEGKRFEFGAEGIRAKTPSISPVPELVSCPPVRLFHAVRRRGQTAAMLYGLRPSKGQWVIMAVTREMALRIGKRKDPQPVVLEVKADDASKGGIRFYATQGILFLAQFVPPKFLLGPSVSPKERQQAKTNHGHPSLPEPPGSFFLDLQRDLLDRRPFPRKKRAPRKAQGRSKRP